MKFSGKVMKKALKGTVIVGVLSAMVLTNQPTEISHAADASPTILINGQVLKSDKSAIIIDGTTYVPLRAIAENFKAEVKWNKDAVRDVVIVKDGNIIELSSKNADYTALINNQIRYIETNPKLIDGTTMIPLRVMGELLSLKVSWDGKTRTVKLEKNSGEIINIATAKATQIKFLDTTPALSMGVHKTTPTLNIRNKGALPILVPFYGEEFRIQVKEFVRGKQPYAIFEIGNTSNKAMTISDENLHFVLVGGDGDDISGSKIENGPINIAPNKVATVKVTAQDSRAVIMDFEYKGVSGLYLFGKETGRYTNLTPIDTTFGDPEIVPSAKGHINGEAGNGKFKFQVQKAYLTDNKNLGNTQVGQGQLVLLKLVIANTSNETLKIKKVTSITSNVFMDAATQQLKGERELKDIPLVDIRSVGGDLLPLEIKGKTIVEGYFPAFITDPTLINSMLVETNLGEFGISGIESFSRW